MKRSTIILFCGAAVAALALLGTGRSAAQAPPAPAPLFDAAFWKQWGDGQAEISSYDLTYPRYNSPRNGVAVTIFVTEPFSLSARVKADPGKHSDADVFPVMKLNLVEDFQTGVYDYNEMTSAFVSLGAIAKRPAGTVTKVTFSSQEWCGHTWLQIIPDPGKWRATGHSYFDGEGEMQRELVSTDVSMSEDQMMHWARGMAIPVVPPGTEVEVQLLPSLQSSRHQHRELAWKRARLTHVAGTTAMTVPAGKFQVDTFKVAQIGGPTKVFYVENGGAKRLVKWESSTGEHAELVRSERMKYWERNKPGDEKDLSKLGLLLRPRRTP
ncbi:MAG: hypothetical protein U0Q16_05905 [Bryobacteraceae bacterium]